MFSICPQHNLATKQLVMIVYSLKILKLTFDVQLHLVINIYATVQT